MQNRTKFLSIMLFFIIAFCCLTFANQNISYAWSADELKISNLVVDEGILNSIDLHFNVPNDLAETTSWVGLQTKLFNEGNPDENNYGDLTDFGAVYEENFADSNAVLNDENFCEEFGIEGFNSEGFSCFGTYSSINTTISSLNIDLNHNQKFYVYLWTLYNDRFYPDVLVATFEIKDGELEVTDSEGNKVKEPEVIGTIEIENANLNLKVGEKPLFTAKLNQYENEIDLSEAFISLDRSSKPSSTEEDDEVDSIRDLLYFYDVDLTIKDSANYIFDDKTKVIINGIEKQISYLSQNCIIVSNEEETITPEGYVAPSELEADFEEKQRNELEEIILQAIKEKKVKYTEEDFENTINEALENEDEIVVDFAMTETIRRSRANSYMDQVIIDNIDSKVSQKQELQAYCLVDIFVFVNGKVGYVSELITPISFTMPLPNGVPQLREGYKRVWKAIRHHEGTVEVLDAKQTENGIECVNDKFSEFGIAYEDEEIKETNKEDANESDIEEKIKESENNEKTKTSEKNDKSNPKTGDNIVIWTLLITVSALGIVATIKILKNRK